MQMCHIGLAYFQLGSQIGKHNIAHFELMTPIPLAGAKEGIRSFFGGNDLDIQQGTSVWVGLPKPHSTQPNMFLPGHALWG